MNQPLVSGIIIFLNGEQYLSEAIESVVAQIYDNWELLLVDDGSSDGSTEIAQRYAREYPGKVRYLEHEGHQNHGMSATRNLGICNAKGKYIAFLDADDIWLPHKLQQQVAILEAHSEVGMVYGRTQIWYSWTGNPEDMQRDYWENLGVQPNTIVQPPQLFPLLLENKAQSPTTCNLIIRRDLLNQLGGFEDSFRGMYEDQAFYTKVFLATPIYVADECWAKYRQHPQSCCAVVETTTEYYAGRLSLLTWIEGYLRRQGIKDSTVWQAWRQEMFPARYPTAYYFFSRLRSFLGRVKGNLQVVQRMLPVPLFSR